MKLPVARFMPDRSPFALDASPEQLNVVPTADGVEPLPGPVSFTPLLGFLTDEDGNPLYDEDGEVIVSGPDGDPIVGEVVLPGTPKGAFYARLADGTDIRIVGTAERLYRVDTTSLTFVDISGPSAPYNVPLNGYWSFRQFGTTVYAQNGVDTEQMMDIASDTAFSDNSTAPIAKYLMVTNDRLHRLCRSDNPAEQQWSGLNNPGYNVIGLRGCDEQVQPIGNGITGGVDMSFGAIVFCRNAIRRMVYSAGSQWIYQFDTLSSERGAVSPGSICKIGDDDFVFYAHDGFFRGMAMQPIGAERVDKWFASSTDESARVNMISALDRKRKVVWFRFQTTSGANFCLGYQWQINEWLLTNASLSMLFSVETAAITIDGLDTIFDTIDDVTPPFDSSFYDGGAVELGAITDEGYFALLNGPNLAATLVSNQMADEGHQRFRVNSGRMDSDAVNGSLTLSTADVKGGTFRDRNPVSPSTRTGKVPFNGDGRVFRITTEIPEAEAWTFFGGVYLAEVRTGLQ